MDLSKNRHEQIYSICFELRAHSHTLDIHIHQILHEYDIVILAVPFDSITFFN